MCADNRVSRRRGDRAPVPALVVLFVFVALGALILPPAASANHSVTELVGGGPGAPGPRALISPNGSRVVFETGENLVPEDADGAAGLGQRDVYERYAGAVTLLSTGPAGTNAAVGASFAAASRDGTHVFFTTREKLVSEDTDACGSAGCIDLYERSGGVTTLVSTGPTVSHGPFEVAVHNGSVTASEDGSRVFFKTTEPLVPQDVDSATDIYGRSGGTTTIVANGPGPGPGCSNCPFLAGMTPDGSRLFIDTSEPLLGADTDSEEDVYEWSGGLTTLVSTGPSGGNGPYDARFEAITSDGLRVFFSTKEPLVAADTDVCTVSVPSDPTGCADIYERSGGSTTLFSTGPADTGAQHACTRVLAPGPCATTVSKDDAHVFFFTQERMTPDDTDTSIDIYRSSGAATLTRVSTGPLGGNGPFPVQRNHQVDVSLSIDVSADGSRAVFVTREALGPGDTDSGLNDVYEWAGGTTTLVSTGPAVTHDLDAGICDLSDDGRRIIFGGGDLVPDDTDDTPDVYERFHGATTLISTGPTDPGGGAVGCVFSPPRGEAAASTADAAHVIFRHDADICCSDNDFWPDLYKRSVGYGIPQSASPIHVSLVPVFRQCGTAGNPPDGKHAPPLGTPACLPPLSNLGQVARIGPQSTGAADLTVVPGDTNPANGDQADVEIDASLTDVRTAAGADYAPNGSGPDVTLVYRLRQTDLANCSPTGCAGPYSSPGTAGDVDFSVPADCAPTGGPEGSDCAANTSADAVLPGVVREEDQAVVQVFRVRVNDSGANGVRGDGDDRIFATQGFYVP